MIQNPLPQPTRGPHLPLVLHVKAARMVDASLSMLGLFGGVALIVGIRGSDKDRIVAAVLVVTLMLVFLAFLYVARRATGVTLTAEYLQFRVPGWLIRTITIPLPTIQRAHLENGGRYYRDVLVFTDDTERDFFLQISAYHSRDLRALLTTIKQLAPQVEYDANVQRLLTPNG